MSALAEAERLLDFSQPFDVNLLDSVVAIMYGTGTEEERNSAEKVLKRLKEAENAWKCADLILERSQNSNTKFFALSILEEVIRYRWQALPREQREGMKNYLSNVTIKMSGDEETFRREKAYVTKLNTLIVEVAKQEWPSEWPTFVPDLVSAAKTSETLCENIMNILKLLSEEVFDFSEAGMTQATIAKMKESLNREFTQIHELCEFVLDRSQNKSLVHATLHTMQAFLSWIPLGYIFHGNLIDRLLNLFPYPFFRNVALQCLTEVASLSVINEEQQQQLLKLFYRSIESLQSMLPLESTDIGQAYASGSTSEQAFVQNLAQFLNGVLREHVKLFEGNEELQPVLLTSLEFLMKLSYVEDPEVFKICLDYWQCFVESLYKERLESSSASQIGDAIFAFPEAQRQQANLQRREELYKDLVPRLRLLMIDRMAKPEEVIVVEDDNGNVVKQTLKDNDVLAQYKMMRETLVFLSHLNSEDTERQMTSKLSEQLSGAEYSWTTLNRLCWAIGSISGSMVEDQENRFLVQVIRDLLNLCENTRGKDHKAVIASNIMYVVGQYPRFLKAHWKFLKTVVNKLFEFMHEKHPGVQDMACDTFLKIARSCKRKFVEVQAEDGSCFLETLIENLSETVSDLEPHQVNIFYEAAGLMASAETESSTKHKYVSGLMRQPNEMWTQIITSAKNDTTTLNDENTMRRITSLLQINTSLCKGVGAAFQPQMSNIFNDMLEAYRLYSAQIGNITSAGGQHAALRQEVKLMRNVKREALKLLETFIERCDDLDLIANSIVPQMEEPVLVDYASNVPEARDAEVLSTFASIASRVGERLVSFVPRLLKSVFQCTVEMVTRRPDAFPEHRIKLFGLLTSIVLSNFQALANLPQAEFTAFVESSVWAMKHTDRNVAELGLQLLNEIISRFERSSDLSHAFYSKYTPFLLREVFSVLTDTFHKPGFRLQAQILRHLLSLGSSRQVSVPLWDTHKLGAEAYASNREFLKRSLVDLLYEAFHSNMSYQKMERNVEELLLLTNEPTRFKSHLSDFLILTRHFSSADEGEFFKEERREEVHAKELERQRQVPGLAKPEDAMDSQAA